MCVCTNAAYAHVRTCVYEGAVKCHQEEPVCVHAFIGKQRKTNSYLPVYTHASVRELATFARFFSVTINFTDAHM